MLAQAEIIQWYETVRMRWRALGVGLYLGRLAMSCTVFALGFVAGIVAGGLRSKPPWWNDQRLETVLGGGIVTYTYNQDDQLLTETRMGTNPCQVVYGHYVGTSSRTSPAHCNSPILASHP